MVCGWRPQELSGAGTQVRAAVKGAAGGARSPGLAGLGTAVLLAPAPATSSPSTPGGPRSLSQATRLPPRGTGPVTDPPWVSASPQAPTTRGGAEDGERRTTAAGGPWPRKGGPHRRLSRQPLEHPAARPPFPGPIQGTNTDHSAAVRRHFRSGLQPGCRRPAVPTSSAPWRSYRARLRVGSGPTGPRKPLFPARGAATPRPQPSGCLGRQENYISHNPKDALCACAAELASSRAHSPRQAEGTFRTATELSSRRRKWSVRGDQKQLGYSTLWGWRRRPRRPSSLLPLPPDGA